MMGKALSGELSCPCDRSCSGACDDVALHSMITNLSIQWICGFSYIQEETGRMFQLVYSMGIFITRAVTRQHSSPELVLAHHEHKVLKL